MITGKYSKVIVLGIDGLAPGIVAEMMNAGSLPNFSRLAQTGTFTSLQTSNPAMSPVCWSNMATGVGPGKHGICDFLKRDPENYLPYLAIRHDVASMGNTQYKQPRKCQGVWALTSAAGIPTSVIRWPVTFPAEKVKGRFLSGLGTPDLSGSEGAYTYYTTAQTGPNDRSPQNVVRVERNAGVVKTSVRGFATGPEKFSGLPMTITTKSADSVRIDIQNAAGFSVAKGAWTKWIRLKFRVGLRTVYGIVKFLLVEVEPNLRIYASPVNIDPAHQVYPITWPQGFGKELTEELGLFHTLGMPEMIHPVSHGRYDLDAFLSEAETIETERIGMFELELNRFNSGLLAFVFDHTDRIQHALHVVHDKGHPGYNESEARKYADVIPSTYRRMDSVLGQVLLNLDDKTFLMVVSDHGFNSFRYAVHMNRWLIQHGYMALQDGDPGKGRELFRDVDWSRTRAYALGFASIYVNTAGREGKGVVSPGEEKRNLCRELAARMSEFKDPRNGNPVVHSVSVNTDIPDLLIGFNPNYRMSWQTALGAAPEKLVEDNESKWTADHIIAPDLIPGSFFCNKRINTSRPGSVDIAPTVLRCFGMDRPGYMDGHALLET